jgi:Fe-S-cluster containining protein
MSPDNNPGQQTINRLERQMERGSFFLHTALSENASLLNEIGAFVYGLIDVLIERGIVSQEEITAAVSRVQKHMETNGDVDLPRIALRIDAEETEKEAFVPVDCKARFHVCKGICCKLNFALSREEIEAGQVKWDLGRPYFIRQETSGFCSHHDVETGHCLIYDSRPLVCRRYSCVDDNRIWKDFEKMELNTAWIEENLSRSLEPRLMQALMHRPEDLTDIAESEKQLNGAVLK